MSCLFDSMLILLQRHGASFQNSLALRHYVVDALLRNPQYRLPAPAPKQRTQTTAADRTASELAIARPAPQKNSAKRFPPWLVKLLILAVVFDGLVIIYLVTLR